MPTTFASPVPHLLMIWPGASPSQQPVYNYTHPAALQHGLGPVTLDIAFVRQVLAETGPIIDQDNSSLWQFARQPRNYPLTALHEADYYDCQWLVWAVCGPAASAVNAVRDKIYQRAEFTVPANGHSRVDKVNDTCGGGAADIIHHWSEGFECAPHEFKRDKFLRVDHKSVLDFLVDQGGVAYGYDIRSREPLSTLEGKGKSIIAQAHQLFCPQLASNSPF
ncbi:hypothetical protein C8R44DRAFT_891439 [Mycena epipterygia]|nr:hypothetical protein C8R44DRAFT_891439 [Mycena epipterygia]